MAMWTQRSNGAAGALRKQCTRQCNPNPTYRVLAGLHRPNSSAAPPPTHSHGEEGSLTTDQDPTHEQRPGGPQKIKSQHRGQRKSSKRDSEELQHMSFSLSHYHHCFALLSVYRFLHLHISHSVCAHVPGGSGLDTRWAVCECVVLRLPCGSDGNDNGNGSFQRETHQVLFPRGLLAGRGY